jgi:RNA polymerase sigma factor (sigma-70 family)
VNPARSPQPRLDAETQRVTRKVFDEVFSRIWLALARYDLPLHDCYDLAQDILLAALESWPRYEAARGEPAVWLNGIIRHHLLRYQERQRTQRRRFVSRDAFDDEPEGERAQALDTARDALEQLMFDEKRRLAHQLYQELPFDLLSVLIDHDLDELTLREVAERHEIPISTAHDRYNVALRKLRAALKRWEAKHRDRGVFVLPFTVDALLDADRAIPDAPADVRAHMWRRFSQASMPDGPGSEPRDQDDPPAPAPLRRARPPSLPEAELPRSGVKVPASAGLAGALPVLGALLVGLVGGAGIHAAASRPPSQATPEAASAGVVSSTFPMQAQLATPASAVSVAPAVPRSPAAPASTGRGGGHPHGQRDPASRGGRL